MKDLTSNISLKQKLWGSSVSVLAVLLFLGFSFIGSLSSVKREMNVMVDDIQPAVLQSLELSQRLQQVSGALGFYLLSKEAAHHKAYVDGLNDLQSGLSALQALPAVSGHPELQGLAQRVAGSVSEFASYKEQMLKLAAEPNLNRPAIGYASTHINPKFREMLQLLGQMALAEEEEEVSDERKALLRSINNLRISWITMNNEIRLFLAFRTPAALDNMKLYRETVTSQTSELQSYAADLNLEQADALEQFSLRLADYFANLDELIRIHSSDKWSTDAYLVRAELTPLLARIQEDLNRIIALQQASIQRANRQVSELYEDKRTQIFLVVSIIFFAVTAVSWLLTRSITRPMQQAVGIAEHIANGRLDNEIEAGSKDEMGQLLCSLKTMQDNLRERIESDARIAGENQRIRTALDNVSSSVMMADSERNILYMNKTAQQLFRDIEEDVKRQFPEFSAERLLDANIDIFHKNPSHQAHILERMTESYQSQLKVGGRTLRIVASPVFDPDGQRLGTAVEWTDRTSEVLVEGEMNEIVAAAHHGDLSRRIDLTNKHGFFKNLGSGINSLIDQINLIFGDLNRVMGRMADGNLSEPIRRDYQGSFGSMKSDVNNTLANLRQIIGILREATLSVRQVSNEIVDGNHNLSARTEQQASSLEETAATMEQITGTVKYNSDNAQQAKNLTNCTRKSAEKGGEVISRAVAAMAAIEAASSQIAEIIGTIDDIAFQTNLLSLNASVEAARAGEQGRGFAVVATEVRNLASRSAVSAREIKALIQDSVEKVKTGVEWVKSSGDTLDEIILGVKKVDNIVSEIAAASSEQAAGIEQVNQAITNMDELTQKNAALAVEASNASSMMSKQAVEMEQLMARFNIEEPVISQAEDRGIQELNFYSARTAHLSWKMRLREFLEGEQSLSESEAVSHRDCELGRWLYGTGLANHGHLDGMQQLEQVHARMHALIKEIVEAKNLGNNAKAEALYADMEDVSTKVIELLNGLEEREG